MLTTNPTEYYIYTRTAKHKNKQYVLLNEADLVNYNACVEDDVQVTSYSLSKYGWVILWSLKDKLPYLFRL